jgi:hypothetical protein
MAGLLADSMVSDAESMIDDDSSDYSPEDTENFSTSDEDYEGTVLYLKIETSKLP